MSFSNKGKWVQGITWTPGHWETTTNPDNTKKELYVNSGFFLWLDWINCYLFHLYFYIGFRPTATWGEGYGDEGWFGPVARWTKRHGFGNFAATLRFRGRGQ